MRRFKGFFLFSVVMLLSLGLASNAYAERENSNDRDRNEHLISRDYRERRDYGRWDGPKLDYDGKTSGIGRDIGRDIGGAIGGAVGARNGGKAGSYAGRSIGRAVGGRIGDSWERAANHGAHDKWNNKGRNDRGYGGGWRL